MNLKFKEMKSINEELFQNGLLDENKYIYLGAIRTRKIVSVFAEIRLLLYIGILLLTSGVGYLSYLHISSLGHIFLMSLIFISIGICFFFIEKHSKPYSHKSVQISHPYFDYIVVFAALLIISLFTYIQVYFGWVDVLLNWTSALTAVLFLIFAYRYDNKAVLSMAITALAAAVGLTISPVNWTKGEWVGFANLHIIGIVMGVLLIAIGYFHQKRDIKSHFLFTYVNFGLILLYFGQISGSFEGFSGYFFPVLLIITGALLSYKYWIDKTLLFFLYSNIAFIIGLLFVLYKMSSHISEMFIQIFTISPVTLLLYVIFLIVNRNHFKHE